MRANNRSNALLIELLIVLLFFMLSATVLLRLFAAARLQGEAAQELAEATLQAQNLAEMLYAAEDPEQMLQAEGFSEAGGIWTKEDGALVADVSLSEEQKPGGILHSGSVAVSSASGEELLTLPFTCFEEVPA